MGVKSEIETSRNFSAVERKIRLLRESLAMDDELLVRQESEARLLWRRLFADCRQGVRRLLFYVVLVAAPVALMFLVEIVSTVQGNSSGLAVRYGIVPLDKNRLGSIFIWPFLHFGWPHLLGNAPFCLALSFLVVLRGGAVELLVVYAMSTVIGGVGVWLTGGPNTVHAGASGVIMGFFGALLLRVLFDRSLVSLIWAAVIAIFYGSLFYILIPSRAYSWQGHLFGFLGGVAAAAILGSCCGKSRQKEESTPHNDDEELGVFGDPKLEQGVDRLASESDMMREVEEQFS